MTLPLDESKYSSLLASQILARQDPDFARKFAAERRAYLKKVKERRRRLNARPAARAARARYHATPKGRLVLELARMRRQARKKYALVLGALA